MPGTYSLKAFAPFLLSIALVLTLAKVAHAQEAICQTSDRTLLLLAVLAGPTVAQPQSDLDRLDEKFTHYFEKTMPGWTHKRVEPVWKGENVLIQVWSSPERSVKISVFPHRSANEAREAVESFVRYERDKERSKDFGDDAYAWGYGLSNIIFRKGKFVVYVSTRVDVGAAPEERTLSQAERLEREKNEMHRLSREFAKHAGNAVDSP